MVDALLGRSTFHRRKTASDNADYLRVIGAGLPRTGTSSLKVALEILGFGPCHHMSELFDKPDRSIAFARALDGHETDFHELLKGYGSTVDAPTTLFYKEIHQVYPKAKIILTVRDSGEKWFESFKTSVGPTGWDISNYIAIYPIRHLRLQCIVARKMNEKWTSEYGGIGPHIHDLHNARVIKETKSDDLLVFNVKEGWAPLCEFLNVPIPEDIKFPNINDTQFIRDAIRKSKIIGWCIWICIAVLVGILIYFFLRLINFL